METINLLDPDNVTAINLGSSANNLGSSSSSSTLSEYKLPPNPLSFLDGDSLVRIYGDFKQGFELHGRGLMLHEFVSSVLSNLGPIMQLEISKDGENRDHDPNPELVKYLIEVFKNVDVNGDEVMSWSEFTGFLQEVGMAATAKISKKAAFFLSFDPLFKDEVTKGSSMVQIAYNPDIDAIVSLERDEKLIRLYTPGLKLARTIDASFAVRKTQREVDTSELVCHAIVRPREFNASIVGSASTKTPGYQTMVVALLTNYTIGVWGITRDDCPYFGNLPRISIEHSPRTIFWSSATNLLWVGCSNGRIFGYDVGRKRHVVTCVDPNGHDDVILSMCSMGSKADALYSSALDGKLLLWTNLDPTQGVDGGKPKVKRSLVTEPGAVTRKLIFMDSMQMVFGLTSKNSIYAWEAGAAECAIKIDGAEIGGVGPRSPRFLDMAECRLSGKPRLITIDSAYTIRVWDVDSPYFGKVRCSFFTSCEHQSAGFVPDGIAMTAPPSAKPLNWKNAIQPPPPKPMEKIQAAAEAQRNLAAGIEEHHSVGHTVGLAGDLIIATAGKMHRFVSAAAERLDPPVGVLFSESLGRFTSCVGQDITMWNGDSGKTDEQFVNAIPGDATCFTFDDRQRKIIIGTHSGELFVNSLMNGSVMKSGSCHKALVSAIRYNSDDRLVISSSADGSLCVFDDEPESELKLLRSVTFAHSVEITALAISSELALIITGDRDGVVKCWDCQDLRLLAVFKEHFTLVTAIATFNAWPFFVSSDAEGQIIICSTRSFGHGGLVKPFRRLYSFRNSVTYEQLGDPEAHLQHEKQPSSPSSQKRRENEKTTKLVSPGVKKVSRKAAQLAILAAMRPPPIDEAAMRKALLEKERLGHLIEAVLEERNMINNPSSVEESRKRRSRIFKAMKEAETDKANMLTFRTSAIQATRHRLQMLSKTMDFPVVSMEGLVSTVRVAHTKMSTIILVTGDDSGRVRVIDITAVIHRLGLKPVHSDILPRVLSHYDAHKGMLREETGGIVEDDFELNREARTKYAEIQRKEHLETAVSDVASNSSIDVMSNAASSSSTTTTSTTTTSTTTTTKVSKEKAVVRGAEADLPPLPNDIRTLNVWIAHEGSVASLSLFLATHAFNVAAASSSAAGSEISPTAGYYVGTTGADARMFVFDVSTGKCSGQLGSTSADNDSWAIGTSQPFKWRFPPLGSTRNQEAMEEASHVLGELKPSPSRVNSHAAASKEMSLDHNQHSIAGGPSMMTELSSTFEPSLASSSLVYEERARRGSPTMTRDPSLPPRPGHSPVDDDTYRHSLEPSFDRVLRDVRLTEAMSKTTAKKELRRAKILGSSIGISVSVGNGPTGGISIFDNKGRSSSDSEPEQLDGDDEVEFDDNDEEEEVHYHPEDMVAVVDMERMATDDVGALEGTGKDLPAPPTRRLDGEKQSTAAQDLKYVISSSAPAATAAVMFGPGAVAVLSLSGHDTSTVQASRAIKKTAQAMMELGKDAKGGGTKVIQELISRQPASFQASFSNLGHEGSLADVGSSSMSFAGGGGGSQLTSASVSSMSSTFSASRSPPITLLDEESAFAIASAVGGLQQKLTGTLKKISTSYTHLKAEVDRSTLGPLASSQKTAGGDLISPDRLKNRKQPIVSFDVRSPKVNIDGSSGIPSATSLYGGGKMIKQSFEDLGQLQPSSFIVQDSPPSKDEQVHQKNGNSQKNHPPIASSSSSVSKIDEILFKTANLYSSQSAAASSPDEAVAPTNLNWGNRKGGLEEIAIHLRNDAYRGSKAKARTNTFDSSGSTSMLLATSRADMSVLRPMSDSQFKGAAILKDIVATARDSQKSERERVSIGRALGVGSVEDFDDSLDNTSGKVDPEMPPPPDKVNADGTKPLAVMPPRFGPYSAVEVIRVRRCFDAADSDGSGDVDLNELLTSTEWRASYSLDQIRNMFDAMDTDKSGKVTIVELFKVTFPNANARARRLMLAWTDPKRFSKSVEQVARKRTISVKTRVEAEEVFSALDFDRDGRVSLEEIRTMFEENNALVGGTGMGGLATNSKDSTWTWKDLLPIMAKYATSDEGVFDISPAASPKKGVKSLSSQHTSSKTSPSPPLPQVGIKTGEMFITKSNFIRLFGDNAWELPER
jgi:Ca2+-binding EF-hand superfamily protein/WD40 repeat protein